MSHACAGVQRQGTLWQSAADKKTVDIKPQIASLSKSIWVRCIVWFGGCSSGSGWGFNKGGSYRNAGAGTGAGGRWTLYRNQRHSATGKRTPERKQQGRDEHNCFERAKTQPNPGCLSSPFSSLFRSDGWLFDYSPAVSFGSDTCACATTHRLSIMINRLFAGHK